MTGSLKPYPSQRHDVVGVLYIYTYTYLMCRRHEVEKKQPWDIMKASDIQPVVDKWDLTCSFSHSYYWQLCLCFGKWSDIYIIRQVFNNHI